MVDMKDPIRDELIRELRNFRRGSGYPDSTRLTGLFYLTEILGNGVPERAFEELERLYERHGQDPLTPVGAFFYLSGWEIGLDSVDQRRVRYHETYYADISTAWRRAERGIKDLTTLIRDRDETSRPWAVVSLFQSGDKFQPFLDFNLGYESFQKPGVFMNGDQVPVDFHVHGETGTKTRYTSRIILPESPLDLTAEFGESMATLRVLWNMPVWPVWRVMSWTAEPRIMTVMRTFRERAIDVSLQWWGHTPAAGTELERDHGVWAQRQRGMELQRQEK
ncbi:hypothetical protein BIU82_00205 [Arthrobacter sp. SW1]|uniref:hypothetical protein n=1 Tax=Arthrobacter sp. SW1 TaxID=1920889 RepID=UPI000877DA7C|nr:hypothetical protein [Arthrobacter sp. SW1]OFI39539.1 hypothetical protein BIU82_00205 [Arthrobacter sp. SW1]